MDITQEDLESITDNVWMSTMGLSVTPLIDRPTIATDAGTLTGVIEIDGAWRGSVTVACSRVLASLAARVFFGLTDDPNTEPTATQIEDALAEVTNMTGGNLKAIFPEPCVLSMPQVVSAMDPSRLPGRVIGDVAFECSGEPFLVQVRELDAAADGVGFTL